MTTEKMETANDFGQVYPDLTRSITGWVGDLDMALTKAGLKDIRYRRLQVRYIREFLAEFPDEKEIEARYLSFKQSEAEALWGLNRQTEAEAVYQTMIAKYPDDAWAYISWSDKHLEAQSTIDYKAAEAILQQALARPNLYPRPETLERLARLYHQWGQLDKQAAVEDELAEIIFPK